MSKNVALALSSGGARGFAYIGAIEELQSRGYTITSVAGSSIGSLIGGLFATGKLEDAKNWLYSVDTGRALRLMDFSLSKNHLIKGDKIIEAFKEVVPDVNIEDLKIPFKAIATDFYTGEEVIFDRGDLYQAIRASISIPSLFRPVKIGTRTLIDGGIVNTLPMNRVDRTEGDILVAINVNEIDVDKVRQTIADDDKMRAEKEEKDKLMAAQTKQVMDNVKYNEFLTVSEKIKLAGEQGHRAMKRAMEREQRAPMFDEEGNYYKVIMRSFNMMNYTIAKQALEIIQPDVYVGIAFDNFGGISDYLKSAEISEIGRSHMKAALDKYESSL